MTRTLLIQVPAQVRTRHDTSAIGVPATARPIVDPLSGRPGISEREETRGREDAMGWRAEGGVEGDISDKQ
jgi:hypothetical protein